MVSDAPNVLAHAELRAGKMLEGVRRCWVEPYLKRGGGRRDEVEVEVEVKMSPGRSRGDGGGGDEYEDNRVHVRVAASSRAQRGLAGLPSAGSVWQRPYT